MSAKIAPESSATVRTGILLSLPIKIVSEANNREHWAAKHRRKKAQQEEIWAAWPRRQKVQLPCKVIFTRYGQKMLDGDNLQNAFKGCRDMVAKLIGVDDGQTDLITFVYEQVALKKRTFSIDIEVVSCQIPA